ncbi:MAG: hypothetical protein JXB04_02605 [Kiritimatiellae bacterium]|nr:hypothetical protein [Kiritimatiellia bacterium]
MPIRSGLLAAVLALLVCSESVLAQSGGARILSVERREEQLSSRNPMYRRMPKFADATGKPLREIYDVHWAPPAEGLEAGAVLVFDYTQEYADGAQSLSIQYPFVVRSQRKATFIISERAVMAAGRVAAWRVRLMQGRRLIAEMASGAWRP